VASRIPSMPLPTPWHHRPTLDVAPRAPRDNPHTAYTQAITESRRPLRRVRGRAHHSGEGRRAPREGGAGGNAPFPPPGTPGPPRTSRPAQPPTHRIHTSNHRQSAATPPCAGPGAPRWRGAHQTRSPAQAQAQAQARTPPATKHALADGGAGGREGGCPTSAPPPHSVRDASPLQKHDTSTRRGAEAGTRRQTRKKRVGGGVCTRCASNKCSPV
jgi:hypothetical protein